MGAYWSTPQGSTLEKGGGEEKEGEEGQKEEGNKEIKDEGEVEEEERWARSREEEMARFREELARKRRQRQDAMAGLSRRLKNDRESAKEANLRAQLAQEELNILKQTVVLAKSEKNTEVKENELSSERAVREAEEELDRIGEAARLEAGEETERRLEAAHEEILELRGKLEKMEEMEKQVIALKDVSRIGKQLLMLRERQVEELTKKLRVIEATGAEYEKEFEKIKELRVLYEERALAAEREHQVTLERETARLAVAEAKLESSEEKVRVLEERAQDAEGRVALLDKTVQELRQELSDVRLEMASKSEQLYHSEGQMSVVNNLLAQVLLGPELDFTKLVRVLEDNHELINDLTSQGEMDRLAAVLLEIAGKADGLDEEVRADPGEKLTREEIASNMQQVWRVLVELLSHHAKKECQDVVPESCYKSVETPFGTKEVISPSRTYIKLKDLILEKNCLVKEVGRLKTLNTHLETRLDKQEKRLSLVTSELHKTWAVVNTLRAQHQQLHNHEKILRYELKHKRMMLEELKKELEICREQWEEARQKNTQTEEDWKVLRSEFASRKRKQCNSTESGFEDEEASESPVELPTSPLPESRASPLPEEGGVLVEEEWRKESQAQKLEGEPVLGWKVDETKAEEEVKEEPVPGTSIEAQDRVMGLPDDLGMEIRVPVLGWETDSEPSSSKTSEIQETRVQEPPRADLEPRKGVETREMRIEEPLNKADVASSSVVEDSRVTMVEEQKRIKDPLSKEQEVPSISAVEDSRIPDLGATMESTPTTVDEQKRMQDSLTEGKEDDIPSSSAVEDSRVTMVEEQKRLRDPLSKEEDVPSISAVEDSRIPNLDDTMGLLQMEIRVPVLAWETEGGQTSSPQEQTGVPPTPPPRPPTPPPLPADPVPPRRRTAEEVLAGREARLRRLEEQCQSLFSRMSSTSQRSDLISNRLEQLHEQYGDQQQQPSTSRQSDQQQ